jgi:hypothetical protein
MVGFMRNILHYFTGGLQKLNEKIKINKFELPTLDQVAWRHNDGWGSIR